MDSLEFISKEIKMGRKYIKELEEEILYQERVLEHSGDPLNAHAIETYKEQIKFLETKIENFKQIKKELKEYNKLKASEKPRIEKVLWAFNQTNEQYIINHYCPGCGESLNKFKHNYCNKCGQKIDWSDEWC